MNYTTDMEKAMYQSHGVGYEQYCQKLEVRMLVEKKREEEYSKGRLIVLNLERKLHHFR